MKARSASYWTTSILIALNFLVAGVAYLLGADAVLENFAELGYPAYLITILGVWKVLGALAILAPRLPLLKEWAYAGIAFNLIGASLSHAAAGHLAWRVIAPLAVLSVAAASWALRPASRTLGAVTGEPGSARIDAHAIAKVAAGA
jgi:hypothetical protein